MKKILYTLVALVLLMFSYVNANADVWQDAFGRKWNITLTEYGAGGGSYGGFAQNMVNTTKSFLNSYEDVENNLWTLEAMLQGTTCWLCAYWTLYWGRSWYWSTTSWKYLKMWCSNHLLAMFEYMCPDIKPAFSCDNIQVQWNWALKTKDPDWTIVIYASSSIKVVWLQVTKVWEYDCKKYSADTVRLTFGWGSYQAWIPELLSPWTINLSGRDIVVKKPDGTIVTEKLGTYNMNFDFYNSRMGKWWFDAAGTCKIRIIADDPEPGCWVWSDWTWNGEWNGILDDGEECDITEDGTKLWTWWDLEPGCDENCETLSYCGDWVKNNWEECDPNDESEENWGADWCNEDCTRDNWSCWDWILDDDEECDYNDLDESDPPIKENWWTEGCSLECKTQWEQPEIDVLKYSGNPDDLDGNTDDSNETNDTQTIVVADDAVFKIIVTNNWKEDLQNIVLEDSMSSDCKWTLSSGKVNGHDVTFSWSWSHDDDILQVGETFSYTCTEANVTEWFENTIVVVAEWVTSWVPVTDNDPTDILIDEGSIDVLKYSGNPDDLDEVTDDSNETNDVQIVYSWDKAVFRIVVTNYGTWDIQNVTLEDSVSPSCASSGTVDLLNHEFTNKEGNLVSFTDWYWDIDNNEVLIPWESFTYECDKANTTADYVNEVTVRGELVSDGTDVDDTDDTEVFILNCVDNWVIGNWEVCDPSDVSMENWGNWTPWCSNECLPLNCNPTDWTKQSWEECDPSDPDEWWGTADPGCDGLCKPINEENPDLSCSDINVHDDYSDTGALDTGVTCYGNSQVETFMLDCGDGSSPMFMDASDNAGWTKATFDVDSTCYDSSWNVLGSCECNYSTSDAGSPTFTAMCSVSDVENNYDKNNGFVSHTNCAWPVNIWSWEQPPCVDLRDKYGWDIDCDWTKTYPGGWGYTIPTYANNSDKKLVCLKVPDEYTNKIELDYFDLMWDAWTAWDFHDDIGITDPFLQKWLYVDQVNQSWEEWVEVLAAVFYDSHVCMLMKSTVPGKEQFDFDLYIPRHTETYPLKWNGKYRKISWESSMGIEFNKPFVWDFKVSDETGWVPKINTSQDYDVRPILKKKCSTSACNYEDWALKIVLSNSAWASNINDTVVNDVSDHKFGIYSWIKDDLWGCSNLQQTEDDVCWTFFWEFNARIDSTTDDSAMVSPIVRSQDMIISYTLGWQDIKYYLTREDYGDNRDEFYEYGDPDVASLWLYVIWTSQWTWKWDITGQWDNFSDISTLEQRAAIKENAYNLISGMTSWQVVNWVKYVEWDYKIDPDNVEIDYETLVVKNGDVTIASDISWDPIWIITLNANLDYSKLGSWVYKYWNVFINSDVTRINAMIYADGWVISSNTNWVAWTENSVERTADLQNQLWLKGALFSKNTIGWAVAGSSGKYKLPGWEETDDFNEAMIYDLNYTRSDWEWAVSGYEDYAFVIEFNSELQNNPPKWFGD